MRLVQTLCHCRRNTGDLDILEVGCGAGFAAEYLSGFYRSYTGIDHSEELIQICHLQTHAFKCHILCSGFLSVFSTAPIPSYLYDWRFASHARYPCHSKKVLLTDKTGRDADC